MPYDEKLANRIRGALAHLSNVKEKQMMGGVSFMVNGKMCVAAHSGSGMLLRCEPEMTEELLLKKGARRFEMKGKNNMKGWLIISPEGTGSKKDFDYWIKLAIEYNTKLNTTSPGEKKQQD